MAIRNLRYEGDEILSKRAREIEVIDDKIKNKYRWRIIMKCKVTSKVLDIINYAINDDIVKKSKDTSIVVDINPSTMN